ncbi:hypothetical protein QJS10_CPA16g01202 [Acorus calamus]|uniref:Uncharacterized protein n=1 Tax=Acorus calamus TaxID=4465 RepID=A0AAV9D1M2_ACOCL|nr:hypothetical protein QJS10_CPA16g01202 [Acorus calamus]
MATMAFSSVPTTSLSKSKEGLIRFSKLPVKNRGFTETISVSLAEEMSNRCWRNSILGFRILSGSSMRTAGYRVINRESWVWSKPWFLNNARTESAFSTDTIRNRLEALRADSEDNPHEFTRYETVVGDVSSSFGRFERWVMDLVDGFSRNREWVPFKMDFVAYDNDFVSLLIWESFWQRSFNIAMEESEYKARKKERLEGDSLTVLMIRDYFCGSSVWAEM